MFIVVRVGVYVLFFFFQAEDGIRDLVRSRGLGDVYKRQVKYLVLDQPVQMAGLVPIQKSEKTFVYRNASALPLSLIHI